MLISLYFTTLVANTIERLIGSDGFPYEKRVDAKGRESNPVRIEDEAPFEIPEGWEWARLGSVFSMQAGKNIKASLLSDTQTENTPYPCFGGNGIRGFVAKPNASGDYPIIGRQGALCGNVKRASGDFYATEHAVIVRCFLNADIAWACLFLSALNLNQYATATAQPGLAVSKISEVLIPIPPLAEQRRIVERVNELMPLVEEYGELEDAREALDAALPGRLWKSVLQLAVQGGLVPQDPTDEPAGVLLERIRGQRRQLVAEKKMKAPKGGESIIFAGSDGRRYEKRVDAKGRESEPVCIEDEIPFEIPEGWEWARLGSVFTKMGSGSTPAGGRKVYQGEGPMLIRSQNVHNEGLRLDDVAHFAYSLFTKRGSHVLPNDMLLNITGASIGRCAIVPGTFRDADVNQHVLIMRPVLPIASKYLHAAIISPLVQSAIMVGQVGATKEGLSATKAAELLVPLPPLAEQHRIVDVVDRLFKLLA